AGVLPRSRAIWESVAAALRSQSREGYPGARRRTRESNGSVSRSLPSTEGPDRTPEHVRESCSWLRRRFRGSAPRRVGRFDRKTIAQRNGRPESKQLRRRIRACPRIAIDCDRVYLT